MGLRKSVAFHCVHLLVLFFLPIIPQSPYGQESRLLVFTSLAHCGFSGCSLIASVTFAFMRIRASTWNPSTLVHQLPGPPFFKCVATAALLFCSAAISFSSWPPRFFFYASVSVASRELWSSHTPFRSPKHISWLCSCSCCSPSFLHIATHLPGTCQERLPELFTAHR